MWWQEWMKAMEDHRNPDLAGPMEAYMRNRFPFLGIPKPRRMEISKPYRKSMRDAVEVDWDFVERCWVRPEREFQYMALGYLYQVKDRLHTEDLGRLGDYITRKSWWDSVDQFPALLGDILSREPKALRVLLDWSLAEDFWLRRAAILHQLLKKEKTDRAALEKILSNNLGSKEFFINKAMGWALRDFSKTDPRWVADFLESHTQGLSSLTRREGSKYLS